MVVTLKHSSEERRLAPSMRGLEVPGHENRTGSLTSPKHCRCDLLPAQRGTTFTSQLWTSLANLLGITLHHTTTYNIAATGMVERFHRTLKASLISRCKDSNWFTQLPWVLLELRTTPTISIAYITSWENLLPSRQTYKRLALSNARLPAQRH
ncbi:uncharacterized protein [Palaemon carinicauda]|uniref:uncharacterized protein n=1 Tax=Palaemon carinicauda TaxID=392227 RepID=UPI0035B59FCD